MIADNYLAHTADPRVRKTGPATRLGPISEKLTLAVPA